MNEKPLAIEQNSNEKQKVAWGRGLFRLWLVLSLIWVAVVLPFVGGEIISPYYSGAVVEASEDGEKIHPWGSAKSRELANLALAGGMSASIVPDVPKAIVYVPIIHAETADFLNRVFAPDLTRVKSLDLDAQRRKWSDKGILRAREHHRAETWKRRASALKLTAGVALMPPSVLLAIGAGFFWAIIGFRRT